MLTLRQRRRLWLLVVIALSVLTSLALAVSAFRDNLLFFLTPTQIANGKAPIKGELRLGGMVEKDSVQRLDGLQVRFKVTDYAHSVAVHYEGILPDLFAEGQGVVVQGRMDGEAFYAREVLAKHDENYMPPMAADG